MFKGKYSYAFLLQFILAAILLAVGIYFIFEKQIVYLVTGIAIVVFSLFRVYPLMKTLNKEVLRTINLIEIIFGVIIGALLIYAVASDRDLSKGWGQVYKYGLAFVFYVRGLVFFTSTVFFEEKTEIPKFIAHIVSITLGSMIIVLKEFDHGTVALLLTIISFIGSVYLGSSGFGNYKIYREHSKKLNEGKSDDVRKDKRKEDQPIVDKQEDDRPYVS